MSTDERKRQKIYFPREVLLVEIERRCQYPDCLGRNLIGLTKSEAIEYRGFDCGKCQRWNDDTLDPNALPESWASELWLHQDDLKSQ